MSDSKAIKRRNLLLGASGGLVSAIATGGVTSRAIGAAGLTPEEPGVPHHPRTDSEIAADVTPTSYQYEVEPYSIRRYGARVDNVADDRDAVTSALRVGAQPADDALVCPRHVASLGTH